MTIFFQNNNKNYASLVNDIADACQGLTYTSETDAPVLPFSGTNTPEVTREIVLQQTGQDAETPIEEATFDAFFDRLTTIKDWFGEPEKARAVKFLELRKLLEENLRDPKVFRTGSIRLEIFAVGVNKDGCLMGVTTTAVET